MLLKPNFIVLYVDNITISSQFYRELLKVDPEKDSDNFHAFKLSTDMKLGLKAKQSVEPEPDGQHGNGELAFMLDNKEQVDALFRECQARKINMLCPPDMVIYGYTFVALDPDGNRLRVFAPEA